MSFGTFVSSAVDSVGKAVKDPLDSASGNIPKACLYVREISDETRLKSEAESLKAAVADAWSIISDLKRGGEGDAVSNHYRKLTVQYNPASISFRTTAGKSVRPMGGDAGGANANQIVQVINPVATEMSCQIILDDMNVFDAFLADGIVLSTGGALSAAKAIGNSALEDESNQEAIKGYSVQAAAEALLSILLLSETRQVLFTWGSMYFRGELTNTNVRFTMFNPQGNPIRAEVNLTIRQGDEFDADERYWTDAFDKVFSADVSSDLETDREEASWYEQILNLKL